MIWKKMVITIKDQPPNCIIHLTGVYNTPDTNKPLIEIVLKVVNDDKKTSKVIFTHNPISMRQEDPSEEDVAAKYHSRFQKIHEKLSKRNFETLLT